MLIDFCLIFVPFGHYDEPEILRYAITSICPKGADVRHRLSTYAVGTFIGIVPGAFVYAVVGAGLGSIFERGESFSLAGVLTPEIVAALIGLSLLALLPVAYKKFSAHRA